MKLKRRLCLFTRYPQKGQTKSRLIPLLGARGAADLQRVLTEHIVKQMRAFQGAHPTELQVWYSGEAHWRMRSWLGSDFHYCLQVDGDIGRKMAAAFQAAAAAGCHHTIVIGADIPGITPRLLKEAFHLLQSHGAVLGPAFDGGYYLIGLNTGNLPARIGGLFEGIAWGSSVVFDQTLAAAAALGLSMGRLPVLQDIDRPQDLAIWEKIRQTRAER